MLIDVNAYIGHWPFRRLTCNTPDGLDSIAKKAGITHMLVSSLNGIFYRNAMDGNLELLDELKNYTGETKLIPFAVINPTYPAWREDMIHCIKELGFKGIELCPTYHGTFEPYKLAQEGAEAFKLAGELGVPVRICMEFENYRQQHRLDVGIQPAIDDLVNMLNSSDKTTFFLNGYIPYTSTHGAKLAEAIKSRPNIFVDISRTEQFTQPCWDYAVENYGVDHMCYGTLSPFYYAETTLVRMELSDNTPEELEKIRWKNVKDYISL